MEIANVTMVKRNTAHQRTFWSSTFLPNFLRNNKNANLIHHSDTKFEIVFASPW